ncbi:MAG: hypothetical protein ACYTG0_30365 [Planctomycetota bacterium]
MVVVTMSDQGDVHQPSQAIPLLARQVEAALVKTRLFRFTGVVHRALAEIERNRSVRTLQDYGRGIELEEMHPFDHAGRFQRLEAAIDPAPVEPDHLLQPGLQFGAILIGHMFHRVTDQTVHRLHDLQTLLTVLERRGIALHGLTDVAPGHGGGKAKLGAAIVCRGGPRHAQRQS